MKLYQKISILAVVGALSLNGNMVRAEDEDVITDADLHEMLTEARELPEGVMCNACNAVKNWIGDKKQKCTAGFCTGQIAYMSGKWLVANKKKACDHLNKDENKKSICGFNWGSATKTKSTVMGALSKICNFNCAK